MSHDPSIFDYVWAVFLLMLIINAVSAVWSRWTGRRPDRDERIRATALRLAIESHGPAVGEEHDACYPARARVFETYLRTGHHKEGTTRTSGYTGGLPTTGIQRPTSAGEAPAGPRPLRKEPDGS